MGLLIQRDQLEFQLAKRIGKALGITSREAFDIARGLTAGDALPEEFWAADRARLVEAITPAMEQIYLDSAEALLLSQPVGVDWALVNQAAADWARTHTFDLVQGINNTSRAATQSKIAAFFEEGLTIGDLRESLNRTFGPVRAEMIASTEVTRAAVEGERALVTELQKEGIQFQRIWITNMDERVCPICAPLNTMPELPTGGYRHPDGTIYPKPPAHVRCRCWENSEIVA